MAYILPQESFHINQSAKHLHSRHLSKTNNSTGNNSPNSVRPLHISTSSLHFHPFVLGSRTMTINDRFPNLIKSPSFANSHFVGAVNQHMLKARIVSKMRYDRSHTHYAIHYELFLVNVCLIINSPIYAILTLMQLKNINGKYLTSPHQRYHFGCLSVSCCLQLLTGK